MTVKRPSAVDGLRRGVGATAAAPAEIRQPVADLEVPASKAPKPARITLNLPPQLYRELIRWTGTAADALDVPKVSVQQALRGMIRAVTSEPMLAAKVMHDVRGELDR
jgi:hypothetical protein